ncbi:MAG: diacylglycerol kinase family protein [Clostridia bacterium]|nr:diacylglycerol kinase family protein [Clostridia bacterium]
MSSYILYNPHAGENDMGTVKKIAEAEGGEAICLEGFEGYEAFFARISPEDKIILLGGDGTLNRFINSTRDIEYTNDIYFLPYGSGNDFFHDICPEGSDEPVRINEYLRDLPEVTVNGRSHLFINGVGFGIDGYCCEVGDELKKKSDKPVNYTMIAIKGLLYAYKPCGATVTVDGVAHRYEKVWIAPTMHGRFYGGGMNAAPMQDRLSKDGKLTVVLFHDSSKLKTLTVFPSIFKGEHIKSEKVVAVHTGYDITVEFDEPRSLQIDGETVLGVRSYRAVSKKLVRA